jgi:hypothetical protein
VWSFAVGKKARSLKNRFRLLGRTKARLVGLGKTGLMIWGAISLPVAAVAGGIYVYDLLPEAVAERTEAPKPRKPPRRTAVAKAERVRLAARLPRPRPGEPIVTGSIGPRAPGSAKQQMAKLTPPADAGFSREEMRSRAEAAAAASPGCDRPMRAGFLAGDRHADGDIVLVHCENGAGFHFRALDLVLARP